ncbi:DoxX family protein [Ferrovibrio sp.]|uniref:DoxX family protein n=1 Tax=Ferrovibrio sp. TaxID=1917215 RepID=UPI0025C121DB|nr:DoxX family protein [Ferrovibrio sp.]MBX3453921.1 DoxX family protein [Ferrovibrio sp.]
MPALEKFGPLLGRILIALLFVPAGISKITGFGGTVGYITSVGLPLPQVGAVLAIVIELGLGLALLAGFKTRYAALGLAVFTLVASFFFHAFWAVPDAQMAFMQQLLFFKNLAVVGGLLAFVGFGAGAYALDNRAKA